MTPVEAAHRLGVHETAVRTVEDRESDCVVTLRDGTRMLISGTVARAYVPVVDDAPAKPARAVEEPDDGAEKDEAPKSVAKKAVTKASKAA